MASKTQSPLPPSVEKAYHQKCIELRRRLNDIEEANDAARLRKMRLERSIMKMRLERAFLLDRLAKSQKLDTAAGDESDASVSPPATPQQRAPRQRRHHRDRSPPSTGNREQRATSPANHNRSGSPRAAAQLHSSDRPVNPSSYPPHSSIHGQSIPSALRSLSGAYIDRRAPSEVPRSELPLINNLPDGTQVIIDSATRRPKEPPWTIVDVEPRHHLHADFEKWPPSQQQRYMDDKRYEPYDLHGFGVNVVFDPSRQQYVHRFRGDPGWEDAYDMAGLEDSLQVKRERGSGRSLVDKSGRSSSGANFTAVNK